MLDTEESRRHSYYHIWNFLVVIFALIRQSKRDAIQYCCKMVAHLSFRNEFIFCYKTPVYRNLEFAVSIFLTVTELGHSEIVSLKLMFTMSSIGYFNFYMWTVNIDVEVNFTGCTKPPTIYACESNQYPCHL